MRYAFEQPPSSIDPDLAEYLSRQFYAVAGALDTVFVAPNLTELPERPIPGGLVYIKDDGLYACISVTEDGEPEWKQVQTVQSNP